jgi:hypothetical protein
MLLLTSVSYRVIEFASQEALLGGVGRLVMVEAGKVKYFRLQTLDDMMQFTRLPVLVTRRQEKDGEDFILRQARA